MNLDDLSLAELKALFLQLPREISKREEQERRQARKQIEGLAAELGFTLDELVNGQISLAETDKPRQRRPATITHRHPLHPEQTWTGRGIRPRWIESYLDAGGNIEELKRAAQSA